MSVNAVRLNSSLSQPFTTDQTENRLGGTPAGPVDVFTNSYITPNTRVKTSGFVAQAKPGTEGPGRTPLEEARLIAKRAERMSSNKAIPLDQRLEGAKKLYIEAGKFAKTGGDDNLAFKYAVEAGLIAKLQAFRDSAYDKGENRARLEKEAVQALEYGVRGSDAEVNLRGLEALAELCDDPVKTAQIYNKAFEASKILEKRITDPGEKFRQRDKSWTLLDKAGEYFFRGEKYDLAEKTFAALAGEIGDKNRKATYGAMAALCHLRMADSFSTDKREAAGEYNKAAEQLKAAIKDVQSPLIAGADERSDTPTFLSDWIKNAWYDLYKSGLLPVMDKTTSVEDLRVMLALVYLKEGDASAAADDLPGAAISYQEAKNTLTGVKDEIYLGDNIEKYIQNIGHKKDADAQPPRQDR